MKLLLFVLLLVVAALVVAVTLAGAIAMIRSMDSHHSRSDRLERELGREL